MRMTVKDFAKKEGFGEKKSDYVNASIILKYLNDKGAIKKIDTISSTGRGRKTIVYGIPENINFLIEEEQW